MTDFCYSRGIVQPDSFQVSLQKRSPVLKRQLNHSEYKNVEGKAGASSNNQVPCIEKASRTAP